MRWLSGQNDKHRNVIQYSLTYMGFSATEIQDVIGS
jgi:hypothetical protein